MSSEYYSLEKAAEVLALPTAEVNRLREKNQLRAFRDGASWKFRKVDVDSYLAESIKNRGKSGNPTSDSDFDLLSMDDDSEESPTLLADLPSFDSIMEDGLSLGGEMIDAAPSKPAVQAKTASNTAAAAAAETKPATKKDNDFAFDDLMLAGDDLTLSEDADELPALVLSNVSDSSASNIDLAAGDDLVLDGTGTSSGINLAGDSGLSLLDVADEADLQPVSKGGSDAKLELDDDDDILSLVDDGAHVEENTSTIAIPLEDDFQLTADADPSGVMAADNSDSSSQVIALDEENSVLGLGSSSSTGSGFGDSPFGEFPATPAEPNASAGIGFGATGAGFNPTPFTMDSSTGTPLFTAQTTAQASVEAAYTPLQVVAIVFASVFLILPGMMILDLIIHIWSWGEPFVVNSSIMNLFAGMAGLK